MLPYIVLIIPDEYRGNTCPRGNESITKAGVFEIKGEKTTLNEISTS
jgi:hypothetical protein